MLVQALTFLIFCFTLFFVCVGLGLSDEESDYFIVLLFEILLSIFYFFIFYRIKFDFNKNKKIIIYSIIPVIIIFESVISMYSPLRLEGGSLKNTITYLWIIIFFQFLKLSFLFKKYFLNKKTKKNNISDFLFFFKLIIYK
jgi:hypothetical protein